MSLQDSVSTPFMNWLYQHHYKFHGSFNLLPDISILVSSSSAANKDMMSKILTNGDKIF